jgi:putative peptidoglycan lipid II flippase
VVLPHLSKHNATEDRAAFSRSLDWGLKLAFVVGLPATLGLVLLSQPMISTLFQYNEFGAGDVQMAGKSLMAFAVGLLAFILIKVLVPGFTSREDTQTPVRFGVYSVICNVILNIALIFPLAHAGVALATSLSAYLNAGLLLLTLIQRKIYRPQPQWWLFVVRVVLASGVMSAFLLYVVDAQLWLNWSASQRGLHLAALICTAMLIYSLCLLMLGIRVRHLSEHT